MSFQLFINIYFLKREIIRNLTKLPPPAKFYDFFDIFLFFFYSKYFSFTLTDFSFLIEKSPSSTTTNHKKSSLSTAAGGGDGDETVNNHFNITCVNSYGGGDLNGSMSEDGCVRVIVNGLSCSNDDDYAKTNGSIEGDSLSEISMDNGAYGKSKVNKSYEMHCNLDALLKNHGKILTWCLKTSDNVTFCG